MLPLRIVEASARQGYFNPREAVGAKDSATTMCYEKIIEWRIWPRKRERMRLVVDRFALEHF